MLAMFSPLPEVAVRLRTRCGSCLRTADGRRDLHYRDITTANRRKVVGRAGATRLRRSRGSLLLLLLLLFLLLELLLTFCLGFFSRLLLARFDLSLMLSGVGLFLLEALLLLNAFLRFLRTLLTSLLELALEVAVLLIVSPLIRRGLRRADAALRLIDRMLTLLFLVRRSVGAALRSLGAALRLIELMLALLFFVSLSVARVFGGTLRRARLFLCALERCLLVTPAGALGALFAV